MYVTIFQTNRIRQSQKDGDATPFNRRAGDGDWNSHSSWGSQVLSKDDVLQMRNVQNRNSGQAER